MDRRQKIETYAQKVEANVHKLLGEWQGGDAALWDYTVSHKSLSIRITSKERRGNVHINCGDCEYIVGPFKWSNCWLELSRRQGEEGESIFILRDERNGFILHCGVIGVKENVEPIY